MAATPPELAAAMTRIDDAGRERFADSYAGLEVDQEQVCAVVHRVPSPAFDEAVVAAAGEQACVVVRDAPHALAELAGWQQRIVDDLPMWSSRGVAISTVGARHDGAGVEVGAEDVPLARHELTGRYGATAPLIFVEQGPVTPFRQL
jgi:hypothetical protein